MGMRELGISDVGDCGDMWRMTLRCDHVDSIFGRAFGKVESAGGSSFATGPPWNIWCKV